MATGDPHWTTPGLGATTSPYYYTTSNTVTFNSPVISNPTCSVCGAVIGDQFTHSEWHENVNEAIIASLQKMEAELTDG